MKIKVTIKGDPEHARRRIIDMLLDMKFGDVENDKGDDDEEG
jgi:hypothetical protein